MRTSTQPRRFNSRTLNHPAGHWHLSDYIFRTKAYSYHQVRRQRFFPLSKATNEWNITGEVCVAAPWVFSCNLQKRTAPQILQSSAKWISNLEFSTPVKLPLFKMPFRFKADFHEKLKNNLQHELFEPSHSTHSALTVLVPQKIGNLKLDIFNRHSNKQNIESCSPMPSIEKIFEFFVQLFFLHHWHVLGNLPASQGKDKKRLKKFQILDGDANANESQWKSKQLRAPYDVKVMVDLTGKFTFFEWLPHFWIWGFLADHSFYGPYSLPAKHPSRSWGNFNC